MTPLVRPWPAFTVLLHPDHNDALFVEVGWPEAIRNGVTVLRFLRFKGPDCYADCMCPSQEGLLKFRPLGWTHWNLQTFQA
jgi:hypothetical protein